MHSQITPLILTYNEAPNLPRTLERLAWAHRIVVLDSGSTDATLSLLQNYPRVECFHRPFDSHSNQNNYGLDLVTTEWVLTLDADYILSEELIAELATLQPPQELAGYYVRFGFSIHGRPVRGSLYPPRAVLFRRTLGRYRQDGHTQRLVLNGPPEFLRHPIIHDDRKSLSAWLAAQGRYAELEFAKLQNQPWSALSWPDRLRTLVVPAPLLVFFYTLFAKGLILDGWPGFFYVLQRTVAEVILSLRVLEAKLARPEK